ncbi:enoyl-CoA hydratase/isomerase family protein (plasmid) [Achromobacter insolitus]|jgi:isohexenylglutaconyl-CoA hydratase|nr:MULTISPECIES: enoyl-CoA hydratase/isomerase family protein [Achromobacter]AVG44042.1 enoyl-CoA hydratase/isomerase family protein [Achromobacter insolitus]
MEGFESLVVRRADGVVFATLNRPATRNALGTEMLDELNRVFSMIEDDASVRALALRGASGMFCAGGNIGGFREILQAEDAGQDPIAARNRKFGAFMERFVALPVPVLAVVEGAAMGGGMGLACAADIVLATEDARFSLSETTLGVIAAQIAPAVAARLGAAATRRLGLSGERISGAPALRIGLVDDLAPDGAALDALQADWLSRIGRCAPNANRAFKLLTRRCGQEPNAGLLDDAARMFARCLRDEGGEGTLAFREKRAPAWRVQFDAASVRAAHGVPPSSSAHLA